MNYFITIYDKIKTIVSKFFQKLNIKEREHPLGRKPILSNSEIVSAAVFKQRENIATKKSLYEVLEPSCSYNRFVVALNRVAPHLLAIITSVLRFFRSSSHPVKFTDSTDIPVCLPKNGRNHRTMRGLAEWSKTGKGSFYGLKLHLSADATGKVLALKFTPGNSDDRAIFKKMNEKLKGLFVADAGYVSEKLEREFFIENERMLVTGARKNMKKLSTAAHIFLLNLRMRVEIHFRVLKLCYGIVTSFPRSIDGYLAHYLSAIAAYLIA